MIETIAPYVGAVIGGLLPKPYDTGSNTGDESFNKDRR